MSLKNSNSFIIGISGGSGSGKTSFIRDIKEHFTKEQICFLSQDDYYKPREFQKEDENGIIVNIEVIWNFELEREILGFGETVKVLSPRSLTNRIKDKLQKAVNLYE